MREEPREDAFNLLTHLQKCDVASKRRYGRSVIHTGHAPAGRPLALELALGFSILRGRRQGPEQGRQKPTKLLGLAQIGIVSVD